MIIFNPTEIVLGKIIKKIVLRKRETFKKYATKD